MHYSDAYRKLSVSRTPLSRRSHDRGGSGHALSFNPQLPLRFSVQAHTRNHHNRTLIQEPGEQCGLGNAPRPAQGSRNDPLAANLRPPQRRLGRRVSTRDYLSRQSVKKAERCGRAVRETRRECRARLTILKGGNESGRVHSGAVSAGTAEPTVLPNQRIRSSRSPEGVGTCNGPVGENPG